MPPETSRPVRAGFWTVPNLLTLSRLGLGLGVVALIEAGSPRAALAVFGAASLTDWLDGFAARRLGQTSAIGRQLDPLVDKLVVCAILIELLTVPRTGLAGWMVSVIVARELLVQAVRSLVEGRGEPFGAKMAGKLKTTFQMLAIAAVLAVMGTSASPGWSYARDGLIWCAVVLTIYSGAGYVVAAWPTIKREALDR